MDTDIDLIVRRKLSQQSSRLSSSLLPESEPRTERRFFWMPFLNKFSYRVERILRRQGYSSAFYSLFTIGHLSRVKDPVRGQDQSGFNAWPHVWARSVAPLVNHLSAYTISAPCRFAFGSHILATHTKVLAQW